MIQVTYSGLKNISIGNYTCHTGFGGDSVKRYFAVGTIWIHRNATIKNRSDGFALFAPFADQFSFKLPAFHPHGQLYS